MSDVSMINGHIDEPKMTDSEIIEALECCCKITNCERDCNNKTDCVLLHLHEIIDLINRQKAEVEALIAGQETLQKHLAEKNAEFERLQSGRLINADELFTKFAGHSDYHGDTILCIIECMAEGKQVSKAIPLNEDIIKSEAIKEFAERLKTKVNIDLCEAINCSDYLYDFPKLVDNLVKEMESE